jgi:hypothetical protein
MSAIFNTMIVTLCVLEINEKKNSAKVEYSLRDGRKIIDKDILEDVFITGLAKYRFDNNDKFVVGKTYKSENNSKDYEACPIKLIRTADSKNKPMFVLKVVNQGNDYLKEFVTPNGHVVKSRFFTTIPNTEWLRYSDYFDYAIKKREEMKAENV